MDQSSFFRVILGAAHASKNCVEVEQFVRAALKNSQYNDRVYVLNFRHYQMLDEEPCKILLLNYRHTIYCVVSYVRSTSLVKRMTRPRRHMVAYYVDAHTTIYDDLRYYMHEIRPIIQDVLQIRNTKNIKFIGFGDGGALASVLATNFHTYCLPSHGDPTLQLCVFNSTRAGNKDFYSYLTSVIDNDRSFHTLFRCRKASFQLPNEHCVAPPSSSCCWLRPLSCSTIHDMILELD